MVCCWRCLTGYGCHIFYENMCYGRTCVVGGHVFQVCAEATIEAALSLGIWFLLGSWMEKGFVCAQISVPSAALHKQMLVCKISVPSAAVQKQ